MIKYMIVFLIAMTMLMAQDIIPTNTLDKPIEQSGADAMFSIRATGALFNGFNVKTVFNWLFDPSKIPHEVYTGYWISSESERSNLITELTYYNNIMPQATENIVNGTVAYYDWYGTNMHPANPSEAEDDLKGEKSTFDTSSLLLYAGRNTAAAGSQRSELEVTTSTGSKYTIFAYDVTTPLVLDMDGDQKLEASNGQWLPHAASRSKTNWVEFDINGDGFDEAIEWVGPNDGLLVLNYNSTEKASGNCLFGNAQGYVHGYEMLSTLDANNDTKITGDELKNLSVWQDKNENAKMDAGEVTPVQQLNITEISVAQTEMMSFFVRDGKNYLMWDWYPTTLMVKKVRK